MGETTKVRKSGERMVAWLRDNFSGLVGIVGALIIAYTGLSIAQNDIEHLEANDARQDKVLESVPKMEQKLVSMDATLARIEKKLDAAAKADKEDAVEDAKYHHKHLGDG
jgi:hypothetical protein